MPLKNIEWMKTFLEKDNGLIMNVFENCSLWMDNKLKAYKTTFQHTFHRHIWVTKILLVIL